MFNRRFLPFYIGLFILIFDYATKYFTHHYLPLMRLGWFWYPYGGIGVFKDFLGIEFSITHQINYGAAWGVLKNYQIPLLLFRMVLVAFMTVYAVAFNKHKSWEIPLAMIISGAIGNIVDYFLYGHVVDMFHFVLWGYDFPVFNVADAAIFLGITSLLILSCFETKTKSAAL